MQTSVLLSIKPNFVASIFEGSKQFEFRRKIFKSRDVNRVVIYATAPVSMVVGEFEIEDIIETEISTLWKKTKKYSGIQKKFFDSYFVGLETGFAIKIGDVKVYDEPLELQSNFDVKYPPQFFVYL